MKRVHSEISSMSACLSHVSCASEDGLETVALKMIESWEQLNQSPAQFAAEISSHLLVRGLHTPSLELGDIIVARLCFSHNTPILWKILEQCIISGVVSSIHILALLTKKVLPHRQKRPRAYRLYLELLRHHFFTHACVSSEMLKIWILNFVDEYLKISSMYDVPLTGYLQPLALFLFCIILILIDSALEDWGVSVPSGDSSCIYEARGSEIRNTIGKDYQGDKENKCCQELRWMNSGLSIEVAAHLTERKKAPVLLQLVRLIVPGKFDWLIERFQLFNAHNVISQSRASFQFFAARLTTNIQSALSSQYQLRNGHIQHFLFGDSSTFGSQPEIGFGCLAATWVPFDIYMEYTMDLFLIHIPSTIDVLAALTKTLQSLNKASWQVTFEALWIAALRLLQRGRNHVVFSGTLVPRLCLLLSILPLVIVRVMDEVDSNGERGSRRLGLLSSLKNLGQFYELLLPPDSVVTAANEAATKAANYVCHVKSGTEIPGRPSVTAASAELVAGNMLHLIVEACIARNLIDTSAYLWPGYVINSPPSSVESTSSYPSPWSEFIDGATLNGSLEKGLTAFPAPGLTAIEKLYRTALSGRDEEKAAAARVFCGASLCYSWNIQEKVVQFIVKLLSTPVPSLSDASNNFVANMPLLHALLLHLSRTESLHILSLYGMIPEIIASVLHIFEAYGSIIPDSCPRSSKIQEVSVYNVFSLALLLLARFWKSFTCPHECFMPGQVGPMGSIPCLDYLLLLRNKHAAYFSSSIRNNQFNVSTFIPVYLEAFPKFYSWYCRNHTCVVSPLLSSCHVDPILVVVNKILKVIYPQMRKGVKISPSSPKNSANVPFGSVHNAQWPLHAAWDILEAVPYVVEASLCAYSCGELSSHNLTIGLRDLIDFFPASFVPILSYLAAEFNRGVWKHVELNGVEWPSPALHIHSFELEVKEMLASVGVDVSFFLAGDQPSALPLPIATLISLFVTFRIDKRWQHLHGVMKGVVERISSCCPVMCLTVAGALFTQKIQELHAYLLTTTGIAVLKRDDSAVRKLLKQCFASFLGPLSVLRSTQLSSTCGINSILGNSLFAINNRQLLLSPGTFFLQTCRLLHNAHFVGSMILELLLEWAEKLVDMPCVASDPFKSTGSFLVSGADLLKKVAAIGASFIFVTGGAQLVKVLFQETVPNWFLLSNGNSESRRASNQFNGCMLAYFMMLAGAIAWEVGYHFASSWMCCRRESVLEEHFDFVVGAFEGKIPVSHPATLKVYVICFISLVAHQKAAWILDLSPSTVRRISVMLQNWHEYQLAFFLEETAISMDV